MLTATANVNHAPRLHTKADDISAQPPHPLTSAGEHDVVDPAVQGADPLHRYLGVVDVLGDEAGPIADGLDGVLQQWVVLDKLQRLVRQVEGAADVLLPHGVVDALKRKKKGGSYSKHCDFFFFFLFL